MKRIQQGLAAILMVSLMGFTPTSEGEFEGTFTYVMEVKKPNISRTMQFKCFNKGKHTLMKMKSEAMPTNMKMMIDKAESNFYMLMNRNGRKIAMKQSLAMMRSMGRKSAKQNEPSVEKTGKTKTIKGYECTLYKINGKKIKGEAWVTDELALNTTTMFNMMQQRPSGGGGNSMVPDAYPEDGVTVKANMRNTDNEGKFSMKIKSIKEKAVNKDRFDISDYEVMNMSGMPQPDK
jgi:hypothetical protein